VARPKAGLVITGLLAIPLDSASRLATLDVAIRAVSAHRRFSFQTGTTSARQSKVRKAKESQAVWEFHWYEPTTDGDTVYRKKVIGTTDEYKTESQAQQAVDALHLTINDKQTHKSVSIAPWVEHYRTEELSDENQGKAFSAKQDTNFI
jgi:hypothetical protein